MGSRAADPAGTITLVFDFGIPATGHSGCGVGLDENAVELDLPGRSWRSYPLGGWPDPRNRP